MGRKFYWMKLKPEFFESKAVKKLRLLAGGDTYTIIYLKMMLKSIATEGKLYFEGIEDNFADELALDICENADNVKMTIAYLSKTGLIEQCEEDIFALPEAQKNIGKECDSAERVRRHRQKALQCNSTVTNCNTEIEIEIEKEIEKEIELEIEQPVAITQQENNETIKKSKSKYIKYGEYSHVKLTQEQYDNLVTLYGENNVKTYIRKIDEWQQMNGKKPYKDYNLAIQNWMRNDGIVKREGKNRNAEEGML